MKNALVGTTPENAKIVPVLPPDDSSIDYHFELQQNCPVSAAAVMAFRTQFFVTRSGWQWSKGCPPASRSWRACTLRWENRSGNDRKDNSQWESLL